MTFASYMDLASAARALVQAGDREGAVRLLSGHEGSLPLHAGYIYQLRAELLAELGRSEAALDVLDEALAAGCRYRAEWLRDNARLSSLRDADRFERIVARADSTYARDQADARPALELLMPTTPRPASGYPVVFVLHGNNGNIAQTRPYWRYAADLGWLVALAQSGEIGPSPGAYTWNDRDRTLGELEQHRADVRQQGLMDEQAVVLAGFSMGGLQALALVLTRRFPAIGAFSVGAYLPHIREFSPLIASGKAGGSRFNIVVGERDATGYAGAAQLAAELERAGVDVRLDARSDLGHAYPPDMDDTLRQGLAFMRAPSRIGAARNR